MLICAQAQKGLEVVMETAVGHLHARWVANGFFTAPLASVNATAQQMFIPYLPESQVTITG